MSFTKTASILPSVYSLLVVRKHQIGNPSLHKTCKCRWTVSPSTELVMLVKKLFIIIMWINCPFVKHNFCRGIKKLQRWGAFKKISCDSVYNTFLWSNVVEVLKYYFHTSVLSNWYKFFYKFFNPTTMKSTNFPYVIRWFDLIDYWERNQIS